MHTALDRSYIGIGLDVMISFHEPGALEVMAEGRKRSKDLLMSGARGE